MIHNFDLFDYEMIFVSMVFEWSMFFFFAVVVMLTMANAARTRKPQLRLSLRWVVIAA